MGKSFRFLLQFAWVNLGVVFAFAAVVTLGTMATGGAWDNNGPGYLFSMYFGLFPLMEVLILYLLSFSLCTTNLNLALSFGARRRDFFWALQGIILVYVAACWALQLVLTAIPPTLSWPDNGLWQFLLAMGTQPWWSFPLVCLTALSLGCLSGLVFLKSKVWGIILIVAACLVGIVSTVLLLVTVNQTRIHLWGSLPWFLAAGMVAAILVSELIIRRIILRSTVR